MNYRKVSNSNFRGVEFKKVSKDYVTLFLKVQQQFTMEIFELKKQNKWNQCDHSIFLLLSLYLS